MPEFRLFDTRPIQEKIVGIERFISMVVVQGPMEFGCSTLRHQLNLRRRRAPAGIRVATRCRGAKLFQSAARSGQDAGKSESFLRIVYVNPIERDVALIAARA